VILGTVNLETHRTTIEKGAQDGFAAIQGNAPGSGTHPKTAHVAWLVLNRIAAPRPMPQELLDAPAKEVVPMTDNDHHPHRLRRREQGR
jgi:hypothetical protein